MNSSTAIRPRSKPAKRGERPTLRILGTEITLLDALRERAETELGIQIEFETLDFLRAQHKATTEPNTYDIYDQCKQNHDKDKNRRANQPIDLNRIARWDEVTDLTKTG